MSARGRRQKMGEALRGEKNTDDANVQQCASGVAEVVLCSALERARLDWRVPQRRNVRSRQAGIVSVSRGGASAA